jgi:hypothetical protein
MGRRGNRQGGTSGGWRCGWSDRARRGEFDLLRLLRLRDGSLCGRCCLRGSLLRWVLLRLRRHTSARPLVTVQAAAQRTAWNRHSPSRRCAEEDVQEALTRAPLPRASARPLGPAVGPNSMKGTNSDERHSEHTGGSDRNRRRGDDRSRADDSRSATLGRVSALIAFSSDGRCASCERCDKIVNQLFDSRCAILQLASMTVLNPFSLARYGSLAFLPWRFLLSLGTMQTGQALRPHRPTSRTSSASLH